MKNASWFLVYCYILCCSFMKGCVRCLAMYDKYLFFYQKSISPWGKIKIFSIFIIKKQIENTDVSLISQFSFCPQNQLIIDQISLFRFLSCMKNSSVLLPGKQEVWDRSIWWTRPNQQWEFGDMVQHKVLQTAGPDGLLCPCRDFHRSSTDWTDPASPSLPVSPLRGEEKLGREWVAVTLVASRLDKILGRTLSSACQQAGTACVFSKLSIFSANNKSTPPFIKHTVVKQIFCFIVQTCIYF